MLRVDGRRAEELASQVNGGVVAEMLERLVQPRRRFAHRRFMLSFGFVLISGTAILSYMGLPEFGVKAAAETEILHELMQPPAHNHMGKLLPIPFDQLVVGAYTTRQVDAVEAGEDPAAAIAAFDSELDLPVLDTNLGSSTLATLLRNRLVLTDPAVSRYHLELKRTRDGVAVLLEVRLALRRRRHAPRERRCVRRPEADRRRRSAPGPCRGWGSDGGAWRTP